MSVTTIEVRRGESELQHYNMRTNLLSSLLLSLTATTARALKEEEQGKLKIFPSDNELVLRNFEDGTYK